MQQRPLRFLLVLAAILGGGLLIARLNQPNASGSTAVPTAGGRSPLAADSSSYDFGRVSMAAGRVSKRFTISNGGTNPVTLTKLYTSCMCTTAALKVGSRSVGPFGMPGHGAIPRIAEVVPAGSQATVDVTFDPAAHGPAGVGRIARTVTLENDGGSPLQLSFTALVTP